MENDLEKALYDMHNHDGNGGGCIPGKCTCPCGCDVQLGCTAYGSMCSICQLDESRYGECRNISQKRDDELATLRYRLAAAEKALKADGDPRMFVDQFPPPERTVVFIDGGVAEYRDGVWYTGMEDPRYQRPIQWKVEWWMPLNPWPSSALEARR